MKPWSILFALTLSISACAVKKDSITMESNSMKESNTVAYAGSETNPLFTLSPLYFNYPPFDKIKDSHFIPAMEQGMVEQLAEMEAIANQTGAQTF